MQNQIEPLLQEKQKLDFPRKNNPLEEDTRTGQEGMDTEGPPPQKRERGKNEDYDEGGESGESVSY